MSIRIKTLLITGLVLVGLSVVLFLVGKTYLLKSFAQLEERQVREDNQRVVDAMAHERGALQALARDWATWDDTYDFVSTRDPGYLSRNLPACTYADLRLNLVAFLHPDGHLAYGTRYDARPPGVTPLTDAQLAPYRRTLTALATHPAPGGLLVIDGQPMLLAMAPILRSAGTGPTRGTLVVGRALDEATITVLAQTTHLNLQLFPLNRADLPREVRAVLPRVSAGQPVYCHPLTPTTLAAYMLVTGADGRPAFVLQTINPRTIYTSGRQVVLSAFAALFLAGLLLTLLAGALLERLVLRRLYHLSQSVISLGARGDPSARITLAGQDELTQLAAAVNGLRGALQQSQSALREQEALHASEAYYRHLVEIAPLAVFIVQQERCIFINQAGLTLLGLHSPADVLGQPITHLVHPDSRARLRAYLDRTPGDNALIHDELVVYRQDGSPIDVEVAAITCTFQHAPALQCIVNDITERKRAEHRLHYFAYHDLLTGLPNRMLLYDRLAHELTRAQRYHEHGALLMLDLDRFKEVNDTLGHDIGDLLLQDVARRLSSVGRASDTIARAGGDEFIMLLPHLTQARDVTQLAARIHALFAEPFQLHEHRLQVRVSIGAAFYPADGDDIDTLVKHADLAMYRAKAAGGGTCHLFSPPGARTAGETIGDGERLTAR